MILLDVVLVHFDHIEMGDKQLEQLKNEVIILMEKEKIMKTMLSTMEEMNLLLRSQSSKCLCGQSADIKLKTKLNVLNNKYNDLKSSLFNNSIDKPMTDLVVIQTQNNVQKPRTKQSLKTLKQLNKMYAKDESQDAIIQALDSQEESINSISKSYESEEDIETIEKLDEIGETIVSLNASDVEDYDDSNEYEFSCEYSDSRTGLLCQKKFTSKKLLLNHVFRHSGPKPWFCEEIGCDYRAIQRNHLIGHVRKSHTGRYQFKCDWYYRQHRIKLDINCFLFYFRPGCDFKGN